MSERSQGLVAGLLIAFALVGLQYGVGPLRFLQQYGPWADPKAPRTATIKNYVVGCTEAGLLNRVEYKSPPEVEKQMRELSAQCAWLTGEVVVVESDTTRARVRKRSDGSEYWVNKSAIPIGYWPW